MRENKVVVGSVIQRSIVPKDISTVLSVASVPFLDISYQESLKLAVTQLFGVATTDCLTDSEYNRALRITTEPEFWSRLEDLHHELDPFFELWYRYFRSYFRRLCERYTREEKVSLADDILFCQLGGVNINNIPKPSWSLSLYPQPLAYLLPELDFEHISDRLLRRFEIKPEHFNLSLRIRASALSAPTKVRVSLKEIYEYHVPFGQSPKTESETLKNIIKQAKNIVVAPLVAGAMSSATLLSTGQYVLAIECALTSGACTIILVASTSIADQIVDHISKRRGSKAD